MLDDTAYDRLLTWTRNHFHPLLHVMELTLKKVAKTVRVCGGASGMEKRQCTVQLTIFVDGIPRVKQLLMFWGQGKRTKHSYFK